MIFKGRKEILSGLTVDDLSSPVGVVGLINSTITTHIANKVEIDYLHSYHKGNHPILNKTKIVRDEINNKTVINHAFRVTRTIVGYFLGNPIQYIQAGASGKKEIDYLNRVLSYESKSSVDTEIGNNQSICGTAFRIIYSDSLPEDEVPFENKSLDPAVTYVVYENNIGKKPLAGITFHTRLSPTGSEDGRVYYIYTEKGVWVATTIQKDGLLDDMSTFNFTPYNVGGVPIVEYPNNEWRMGDWEFAIPVMDAIDQLQSGRLDDIEQVIESLLVFINADIDGDTYKEMREQGVVILKNTTNAQSSIESVKNPLDQTAVNLFAKELELLLDTLVGIPSRENRGGGGGDTGQAVELRDGWADLEIVARNKEAIFKRAEQRALKIIINILNAKQGYKLPVLDVDIKFTRNKNHNLLVKTQSYETLLNTRSLTPSDCLTIVDLVSDVNEYATRGQAYWDKIIKEEQALEEKKAVRELESKSQKEKTSEL
jgi:SPP1 family phage portal protein